MESGGVISDASWAVFDLSSQGEESDIMAQLLRSFPSHGEEDHQELPWCDQASNPYYFHCNPNSSSSSSLIVPSEYDGFYFGESNKALGISSYTAPLDLSMDQGQGAAQCLDVHGHGEVSCEDVGDSSVNLLDSFHTTNKRKRPDGRTRGQKCTRKADSKRMKKLMRSENGDDTSENDSNASQESPADATPNGKAQAGRRSTTDPHSLYARKRRERINERLRILQNLVPNGTKVDISTMLEEAVHYVKFLQLQIKLLSSDEMWMYAPIAYNGMSIGIDLNIPEH